MCLNSSKVVEPTTRSSPEASTGLISVARSSVPPGGGARAHRRVDFVDEEDGPGPLAQRRDDRLEALLEVAAEARAGEQRRRVEREHLRALQQRRHVLLQQAHGEPLGHRRLADARVADEHRVVLAPAAQDLQGALQLDRPADQGIEHAGNGLRAQARGVGAERVARGARGPPRLRRLAPGCPRPGPRPCPAAAAPSRRRARCN